MFRVMFALLFCWLPVAGRGENRDTILMSVRVEPVVEGLIEPWSIGFLPSGNILITERGGRLLLGGSGSGFVPVDGVPPVFAKGQGGLMDVVPARNFAATGEIFLTYAEPRNGGAGTNLAVAILDENASRLRNLRVIFRQNTTSNSTRHFGGRVVENTDGTLMLTLGERGTGDLAQALDAHNGKVVRINRDGTIPLDNPFVNGGALPEIWSLGHRNPQGAALDAAGNYWTVEHGAMGGDEINRPMAGKNYGWPVITYGLNYDGNKIGVGTEAPGYEQPAFYWDPSIAPSGMTIYSGRMFSDWSADIFVGSLKFDMISRLEMVDGKIVEAERLFQNIYGRIRDIREAPDGSIWFLSVADGAAYRISAAE